VGIFGKDLYAADVIALGALKQKSSTWSGRLVFLLVGVVLAIGICLWVRNNIQQAGGRFHQPPTYGIPITS
jgi:hypothetical protein